MDPLQRYLSPLSQGWLLPGMWVWNASFNPLNGVTICHAIQFASVGGGTVQFGTSDHRVSVVRHGAWAYEEDGEIVEEAAVHEVPFGAFESIDVFLGTYELKITGGTEPVEVLAGLRFNMKRPDSDGKDRSIGFLHSRSGERFRVGFASTIFADMPAHIRLAETIVIGTPQGGENFSREWMRMA